MEPCSSLWRRGNGHLVSLRTYSSCVLVRSDVELLLEGVDDMVLVERALCCRVGSEKVSGILSGEATRRTRSQKNRAGLLVNTRTHLYGTLTGYQRHNKTLSWFSRSHSAEWLSSGRSVAASRRANFCPWGAEVNYQDCSPHFLGCGEKAVPAFPFFSRDGRFAGRLCAHVTVRSRHVTPPTLSELDPGSN